MVETDTPSLTGRRILVVEDEYFLADDLNRALAAAGAEVLGPVNEADEALRLIRVETRIDGGVLDINVRGAMVYTVAEELSRRSIPFVFATGYDQAAVPSQFGDIPRWEKPFDPETLVRTLPDLIQSPAIAVAR